MSTPLRMLLALQPEQGLHERVHQAAAWARRFGARLDLATVVTPHTSSDPIFSPATGAEEAVAGLTLHQKATDWLEALLADIPEDLRGRSHVLSGDPTRALIEASADTDVLIVGTHHRTDVVRLFLGSVAETVVREAKCHVLVLSAGSGTPTTGPLAVRAPFDIGSPNGTALNWVARHVTNAHTTAVYVLPWVTVFDPIPSDGHELYDRSMGALRDALATTGHAETEHVVLVRPEMSAGDALAHEADEARVDLIAMPTHGRTGIARAVLGSVAERTVRAATTAVLIVRQPA